MLPRLIATLLILGAMLAALPVMVLYFLARRFMIQGMTSGSVKG